LADEENLVSMYVWIRQFRYRDRVSIEHPRRSILIVVGLSFSTNDFIFSFICSSLHLSTLRSRLPSGWIGLFIGVHEFIWHASYVPFAYRKHALIKHAFATDFGFMRSIDRGHNQSSHEMLEGVIHFSCLAS